LKGAVHKKQELLREKNKSESTNNDVPFPVAEALLIQIEEKLKEKELKGKCEYLPEILTNTKKIGKLQ
jgi:hypothetical protein